jgi:hypothetical protein
MADLKISALTASTVPLAGTEVLPIVQSSTTKQVSVANLTAGRAVAMLTANVGDASSQNGVFDAVVGSASATTGDNTGLVVVSNATGKGWIGFNNANNASIPGQVTYNHNTNVMDFYSSGSFTFTNGNVAFATAAKGINYTANTPAAGMTSQLLNWYEEGTWTPSDQSGAGLTFTGVTARYTRVGRQVTCQAVLTYPATASGSAAKIGGLPFTQTDLGSGVSSYVSSGGQQFFRSQNSSTNIIPQNVTGNDTANATLSGVTLLFTFVYTV